MISDTLHLLRKYFRRFYNTPSTFSEMKQKYSLSDKYKVLIKYFNMKRFIKTFKKKNTIREYDIILINQCELFDEFEKSKIHINYNF